MKFNTITNQMSDGSITISSSPEDSFVKFMKEERPKPFRKSKTLSGEEPSPVNPYITPDGIVTCPICDKKEKTLEDKENPYYSRCRLCGDTGVIGFRYAYEALIRERNTFRASNRHLVENEEYLNSLIEELQKEIYTLRDQLHEFVSEE